MGPHRRQPTRLPHPWDSPGKNTGVDCHFLLQCMQVKSESEVAQSCPTLSDHMNCSLPGSSVHGIFQARVLKWGATAFSHSLTSLYFFPTVVPSTGVKSYHQTEHIHDAWLWLGPSATLNNFLGSQPALNLPRSSSISILRCLIIPLGKCFK